VIVKVVFGWIVNAMTIDVFPKLLDKLNCEFEVKQWKNKELGDTFCGSQHLGGKRACWSSGKGLGRLTNTYSIT
jgi:hypothetical protein